MTALERADFVRSRLPAEGLFADKEWRVAPHAFPLTTAQIELLTKLGPLLHKFAQACNLLYRQSVRGKQPPWIAALLDRGKPAELIALSRRDEIGQHTPAVIRPDLVITENGFALCELDTVPGGIGLTAWLQETYAALDEPVLGGANGMRTGFQTIFPEGHVVISREAGGYRPEFNFLVGEARVREAETYRADGTPIYRFFECFDWPELPALPESWQPGQPMTPPLKPYLEEKLWLALFWMRPLSAFWRRELSDRGIALLRQIIPYTWLVDPTPLPPHAVIPELEVQNWNEVASFSQKERELILKISGFSPQAWGARGVFVGSDLPTSEWTTRVTEALAQFPEHPYILQRFAKGALFEQTYVDAAGTETNLRGRVRLCPYYFAANHATTLHGALVTLCPADKKVLHGMRDAILSPAKIS